MCLEIFKGRDTLEIHKKQHLNEELIRCERCDEKFATKRALYKHMTEMIKNHGPPRFMCSVCDEEFSNKSDLSHHIKSIHDGKVFMCDICQSLHRYMSALKIHRKTHSQIKNFECNICDKKYSEIRRLKSHIDFEHNGIGYECKICNKSFASPDKLKRHLFTHSDKKIKCDQCDKAFFNKQNLQIHISTVHLKLRPFKCNECGKDFPVKKNLTGHISAVHDKIKKYQCDVCQLKFSQKHHLDQHMPMHTGIKPFDCSICGKSYTTRNSLNQHTINVHNKIKDKIKADKPEFECEFCLRIFTSNDSLQKHLKNHSSNDSYKCFMCKMEFQSKDELKSHKNNNMCQNPNLCNICNKRFTTKVGLNSHKLIHQEKRFKCNFCFKLFHQPAALRTHEKMHSSEVLSDNSFQCRRCKFTFNCKKTWLKHLRKSQKSNICPRMDTLENDSTPNNLQNLSHCSNHFVENNSLKDQRKELVKNYVTFDKTNVTPSAIHNQQTNTDRHVSSTHFIGVESGSVKINASSSFSNQKSVNSTQFNDQVPFEIQTENSNQSVGNQDVSFHSVTNQATYTILNTVNNFGYINPSPSQASLPDNFNNLQATDVQSERTSFVSEKFILNHQTASTIPYHPHPEFSLIPSERNFQNMQLTSMQRESVNNADIHFPTLNQSQIVLNKFNQH